MTDWSDVRWFVLHSSTGTDVVATCCGTVWWSTSTAAGCWVCSTPARTHTWPGKDHR